MVADKSFVQGEENARSQGREGSLKGKKTFLGPLVARAALSSTENPVFIRITSKLSDCLKLVPKELWRASAFFQGTMSLISSVYSRSLGYRLSR